MILTKFQVNWPFDSGEEVKNRFSRWPPWRPFWISIGTILAIFDLPATPMLPTNWPFGSDGTMPNRIGCYNVFVPNMAA